MDKYISFIIIVIIIYKTYEYCSPHKEGFSMPDFSVNFNGKPTECDKDTTAYKEVDNIVPEKGKGEAYKPCQYKSQSCKSLIDKLSRDDIKNLKSLFEESSTSKSIKKTASNLKKYSGYGMVQSLKSHPDFSSDRSEEEIKLLKSNCEKCLEGSAKDSSIRKRLANIKKDSDTSSKFSSHTCDALAYKCEDPTMYGIINSPWSECDDTDNLGIIDKIICFMLNTGIIDYYGASVGGGGECFLRIQADRTL